MVKLEDINTETLLSDTNGRQMTGVTTLQLNAGDRVQVVCL